MLSGLDLFEKNLDPKDVAEIRTWSKPSALSGLLTDLQKAKGWQQFLNHYAEAVVALHLIRQGCDLQYEVPTVDGRKADLKVSKGMTVFFIHVKRANLDKATAQNLQASKRLDCLRRISRPITVNFTFFKSLTDREIQWCCKEAREFVQNASEGERKEIRIGSDAALGEFEIGPSHNGRRVLLAVDLPAVDGDRDSAIHDQLVHAYERFMPGFDNLILATSFWRDDASVDDMRDALDDFWAIGRHPLSNICVYFTFDPKAGAVKFEVFSRNGKMPSYVAELFGECPKTDVRC